MKQKIHPSYYEQATVRCACGHTWQTGSAKPELAIEICSQCHPFFSGQEKVVDTSGRVEKFKKRQAKIQKRTSEKLSKNERGKTKKGAGRN